MKRGIVLVLGALVLAGAVFVWAITRGGSLVVPEGSGSVEVASGVYEGFPLPDYAAAFVPEDIKSYFVEVEPGIKLHILEIGTGYPVLMVHGNPTSGFLYRKVVEELPTDRVRIIMPTLVGLGFSSKVPASRHTLENHRRWLHLALEELELTELVYVGQDWGGPVGVGALAYSPGVMKGAVILNTGLNAPVERSSLSRAHDIAKTPIVGELVFEVFVSLFDRLHEAQGDPASIPPEVAQLYGKPLFDSGNAKAPLAMMRMVPNGPDEPSAAHLREIERYVAGLDIPAEIVWGMQDPILARGLAPMKKNFPNARVTETEAGHFLQEEVPEAIAAAVLRVLDQAAPQAGD